MIENFVLIFIKSTKAHSSNYAANHKKIEDCTQICGFGTMLNILKNCVTKFFLICVKKNHDLKLYNNVLWVCKLLSLILLLVIMF